MEFNIKVFRERNRLSVVFMNLGEVLQAEIYDHYDATDIDDLKDEMIVKQLAKWVEKGNRITLADFKDMVVGHEGFDVFDLPHDDYLKSMDQYPDSTEISMIDPDGFWVEVIY